MALDTHNPIMVLTELCAKSGLPVHARGGDGDPIITEITYDSRTVVPGALYVAIPGTRLHGDHFIAQALANGAVAILSENQHPECRVPWVQSQNLRCRLGILGKTLWNVDTGNQTIIGITGTNGKTTVAHLYQALHALQETPERVWMFGTIDYHIEGKKQQATHTTPEALHIFRAIGSAAVRPRTVVMEVSSHSLALDRVSGLSFDTVVFMNLTQDHLDFHIDMESYFYAKQRLFTDYIKSGGWAVINCDDQYGRRLATSITGKKTITFGRSDDADVRIAAWECDWDGCKLAIVYRDTMTTFTSKLRGFFNLYNMAALIAGAFARETDSITIQHAFDHVPVVAGRMERVILDAPFTVVVDYAHTPDALHNVLRTARELTNGRLLCVFGCGGDRDRTKRPPMGEAVARRCDEAWITSDNPRSEDPMSIINDIIDGVPLDFPHHTQPDRKEAIYAALREARRGDCLVIAGKGHENYQEIKGVKHHFDDKEMVIQLYTALSRDTRNHA